MKNLIFICAFFLSTVTSFAQTIEDGVFTDHKGRFTMTMLSPVKSAFPANEANGEETTTIIIDGEDVEYPYVIIYGGGSLSGNYESPNLEDEKVLDKKSDLPIGKSKYPATLYTIASDKDIGMYVEYLSDNEYFYMLFIFKPIDKIQLNRLTKEFGEIIKTLEFKKCPFSIDCER